MAPKITSQYAITALACITGILFGTDISSMSLILDLDSACPRCLPG